MISCSCLLIHTGSVAQELGTVTDLSIGGDPGNERGYLLVTIQNSTSTFRTPVCNQVNFLTAEAACINIGWFVTIQQGTIRSFG